MNHRQAKKIIRNANIKDNDVILLKGFHKSELRDISDCLAKLGYKNFVLILTNSLDDVKTLGNDDIKHLHHELAVILKDKEGV